MVRKRSKGRKDNWVRVDGRYDSFVIKYVIIIHNE